MNNQNFLGNSARFRLQLWACQFLRSSVCLSVCLSVHVSVTFVRTGHTLAKITNVKITFTDFDFLHRLA